MVKKASSVSPQHLHAPPYAAMTAAFAARRLTSPRSGVAHFFCSALLQTRHCRAHFRWSDLGQVSSVNRTPHFVQNLSSARVCCVRQSRHRLFSLRLGFPQKGHASLRPPHSQQSSNCSRSWRIDRPHLHLLAIFSTSVAESESFSGGNRSECGFRMPPIRHCDGCYSTAKINRPSVFLPGRSDS